MKRIFAAIALVATSSSQLVLAGTGVPPACSGGAFTNECLDFNDAVQEGLVRHRLDNDQDVGTGAPIAHRSEAQKAEVMRLFRALLKVERENSMLKHRTERRHDG